MSLLISTSQNQIKQLLELIGPAIHTIQKMIGCWDAIAGDLQSIKTMVADPNSSTKGNNIVRKLVQKNICKKWDALAKAGERLLLRYTRLIRRETNRLC